MMRRFLMAASAAAVLTTLAPDANAAVCAAGAYRAGCVGPHGAVVVRKHCYYRAGVRICR
jgi:hypothetical protein